MKQPPELNVVLVLPFREQGKEKERKKGEETEEEEKAGISHGYLIAVRASGNVREGSST